MYNEEQAKVLMAHIGEVEEYLNDDVAMTEYAKRTVIRAMRTARFQDAFPQDVIEDVFAFAREEFAAGSDVCLVGLQTASSGLVVFRYFISTSDRGTELSPGEFFVPKRIDQVALPAGSGGRCLVIDVGSLD